MNEYIGGQYVPSLAECEADEHQAKIEALATSWREQIEESGIIYSNSPFPFTPNESDIREWAEKDGYPHAKTCPLQEVLEHEATVYLHGSWD